MPTFITQKTCEGASRIKFIRRARAFEVTKVNESLKKSRDGKLIGSNSPRVEKKLYPATHYNKSIILQHYGRYETE